MLRQQRKRRLKWHQTSQEIMIGLITTLIGHDEQPKKPVWSVLIVGAENLQKLDEIDRKDVWIFVLKNPAYIESTNNKIEELKPIKRYENEKGWDVLLDK